MNENKINYNGRFEINELIDHAVNNAVARRSQVIDSEDALLVLTETEAQGIVGGAAAAVSKTPLITTGKIAAEPTPKPICQPIVLGLIAVDSSKA
jgi:hypothetical protein